MIALRVPFFILITRCMNFKLRMMIYNAMSLLCSKSSDKRKLLRDRRFKARAEFHELFASKWGMFACWLCEFNLLIKGILERMI